MKSKKAKKRFAPMGDIIVIKGKKAHVFVTGQGPDIVLIHGSNANILDLHSSVLPFLSKHFRVIMVDRPGLGHTPSFNPKGETLREQALFIRDVAAHLGASKPIVLGHSFGGAVALAWAVYAPKNISGLMLLSGVSNRWPGDSLPIYRINKHPIIGHLTAPIICAVSNKNLIQNELNFVFTPQQIPDYYTKNGGIELLLRPPNIIANARHRNGFPEQIKTLIKECENITIPTKIMHGTMDKVVSCNDHSARLSKIIPNAEFIEWSDMGHMPHHFKQDEIARHALDLASNNQGN